MNIMISIPYSKNVYVIIETPQNPYQTEDPITVRNTILSWDVDGVFLNYNSGFGEKDRFHEYLSALEDYVRNIGFVVNAFGPYYRSYAAPACTTGENVEGWIDPYLIYKNGINFDEDEKYKSRLDTLSNYINRLSWERGRILFDHIRYPQGDAYCPNCSTSTWQNHIYNVTQATFRIVNYLSTNTGMNSSEFGAVMHPPRNSSQTTCCQAWNVGQAYDDVKGLTAPLGFGAMILYYIPREDYIWWMYNLATKNHSYNGYSTNGTKKELFILLSTYPGKYKYY
ncbi:MAG: hypothetical protein J7L37_02550, partial [Thermococcus sp.]|nr:hypothetical protein [Thermococcus sp.]